LVKLRYFVGLTIPEAEAVSHEGLELKKKLLGDDHAEVATLLSLNAIVLDETCTRPMNQ
jgi:hypothetical protein